MTPSHAVTIATAPGSRRRRIALAWASTCAGQSASQVPASMKNRTIALTAATSIPLPLTSPTSTASAPSGWRQTPKTSPPETSWPTGS